jgi:hypothetical protein
MARPFRAALLASRCDLCPRCDLKTVSTILRESQPAAAGRPGAASCQRADALRRSKSGATRLCGHVPTVDRWRTMPSRPGPADTPQSVLRMAVALIAVHMNEI